MVLKSYYKEVWSLCSGASLVGSQSHSLQDTFSLQISNHILILKISGHLRKEAGTQPNQHKPGTPTTQANRLLSLLCPACPHPRPRQGSCFISGGSWTRAESRTQMGRQVSGWGGRAQQFLCATHPFPLETIFLQLPSCDCAPECLNFWFNLKHSGERARNYSQLAAAMEVERTAAQAWLLQNLPQQQARPSHMAQLRHLQRHCTLCA